MKIKILNPADYFAALSKAEWDGLEEVDNEEELEEAIRAYLLGLSPMQRQQLKVHAPNDFLRVEHESRVDRIDGYGGWKHKEYLRRLARVSGSIPRNSDELKTLAAVGAAIVQRNADARKQRIKEHGRRLQCQMCAGYFYSADTERIKPYGSTRYQRFCKGCAEKVKEAKTLYRGMKPK